MSNLHAGPPRKSFGSWLGRKVLNNLRAFFSQMSRLPHTGKLLGAFVGIFAAGIMTHDDPDPRFKRIDIPFNQMYSSEWWFWLVVNIVALCCLLAGIGYILSRPANEE